MTAYPQPAEAVATASRLREARAIIAALTRGAVTWSGGILVCNRCGAAIRRGQPHTDDCPVGRALAWLEHTE